MDERTSFRSATGVPRAEDGPDPAQGPSRAVRRGRNPRRIARKPAMPRWSVHRTDFIWYSRSVCSPSGPINLPELAAHLPNWQTVDRARGRSEEHDGIARTPPTRLRAVPLVRRHPVPTPPPFDALRAMRPRPHEDHGVGAPIGPQCGAATRNRQKEPHAEPSAGPPARRTTRPPQCASVTRMTSCTVVRPFLTLRMPSFRKLTMPRSRHRRRNSATLGLRVTMSRSWSSTTSSS